MSKEIIRRLRHPVSDIMLKEIGDFVVTYALLENQLRTFAFIATQKNTRIGALIIDSLNLKPLNLLLLQFLKKKETVCCIVFGARGKMIKKLV